MAWIRSGGTVRRGRGTRLVLLGAVAVGSLGIWACDNSIVPPPPKQGNLAPETFLYVQGDSLKPHLYKILLRWYGSDPDGGAVGYRYWWTCATGSASCRLLDSTPVQTAAVSGVLTPAVPDSSARYTFWVAAVDNDGAEDPTPASQTFDLYNHHPVASFQVGTLPQKTLPAVTFYPTAIDPDSTPDPNDHDSRASIAGYEAWLDGQESDVKSVTASQGGITFFPTDFRGRYGQRIVYVRAVDDGQARSQTIQHPWVVAEPPQNGVLLVDDCRMGGNLATFSDTSFAQATRAIAPGRVAVLDVAAIPRLSRPDLEATLSLFDKVVWYTDIDTVSSGALELSRQALLDMLEKRAGKLFLSSGLAFGTRAAFGDLEGSFRQFCGVDSIQRGPYGTTNFPFQKGEVVKADTTLGLVSLGFLTSGLDRATMDCFATATDGPATRKLYFYPESTLVREGRFGTWANTVRFDVGVYHKSANGAQAVYVSFPIGIPMVDGTGARVNEAEIEKLLRMAEFDK